MREKAQQLYNIGSMIFIFVALTIGCITSTVSANAQPLLKSCDISVLNTETVNTVELAPLFEKIEANSVDTTIAAIETEAEPEWNYLLRPEEINLIALVTMAEAEGETELGKRLVIDTILNRVDNSHFPDTVYDVIYQPYQFSVIGSERLEQCYVMPEIVELVKEELTNRTNSECIFFMAGGYSKYGKPLFQECCHYFSSYD